jgi:hypothetical protein
MFTKLLSILLLSSAAGAPPTSAAFFPPLIKSERIPNTTCDKVSSGVDDDLNQVLTRDEVIVTVVVCPGQDPIIRTKGK